MNSVAICAAISQSFESDIQLNMYITFNENAKWQSSHACNSDEQPCFGHRSVIYLIVQKVSKVEKEDKIKTIAIDRLLFHLNHAERELPRDAKEHVVWHHM